MKNQYSIYIKNMVCPRCIDTVNDIFDVLNIEVYSIKLGEVIIPVAITHAQKVQFEEKLSTRGFELLEGSKSKLINQI